MKNFSQIKAKIKAAKTKQDICEIYIKAMENINDAALYNKIINECVKQEIKINL